MDDLGVLPFQENLHLPPCWMHPPAGPWRLHPDALEAFAAADDFAHGTAGLLQVLQASVDGSVQLDPKWIPTGQKKT